MHSTSTLGSCYAITANSSEDQAKACIDFWDFVHRYELADLYTYGIEGEDYTLNDEEKLFRILRLILTAHGNPALSSR